MKDLSQDDRKNRVTVDIYGQAYTIVGPESNSHMRHVASYVDEKMREISVHNPSLDVQRLAVLTAVNAVHEYMKIREDVEKLEQELQQKRTE